MHKTYSVVALAVQKTVGGKRAGAHRQIRKDTRIPFALSVPYCHYRPAHYQSERRQSAFFLEGSTQWTFLADETRCQ